MREAGHSRYCALAEEGLLGDGILIRLAYSKVWRMVERKFLAKR
jgi:hypothetical protein